VCAAANVVPGSHLTTNIINKSWEPAFVQLHAILCKQQQKKQTIKGESIGFGSSRRWTSPAQCGTSTVARSIYPWWQLWTAELHVILISSSAPSDFCVFTSLQDSLCGQTFKREWRSDSNQQCRIEKPAAKLFVHGRQALEYRRENCATRQSWFKSDASFLSQLTGRKIDSRQVFMLLTDLLLFVFRDRQ